KIRKLTPYFIFFSTYSAPSTSAELQNFTITLNCNAMRNILSISKQVFIYFFIILFVYAAVSKLTDFENFQVQVAQSPLLSAFATVIAYATVIGELVIVLMLCFVKSRT